ncbi:MAG: biopolymer transporter Tol [Geitlerinemataceae cyanobacterium]
MKCSVGAIVFSLIRPIGRWATGLMIIGLLSACGTIDLPADPLALNSYYTEEQPALSGNGRFLAYLSNRDGQRQILMYDLQEERFVSLPGLDLRGTISQSPSLSYTARYLAYLAVDGDRPAIKLYDRLTGQTQVLTSGYRSWVGHPSLSEDGRYIAFETADNGQLDIEILDRGSKIEFDRPEG